MGKTKWGQRRILIVYCKDADCALILLRLLKLIYEDRCGKGDLEDEAKKIR